MEKESASLRNRTVRNARETTPEPNRKELNSDNVGEIKTKVKENVAAIEAKYVVRGVLNVGPPSPAGSSSSSGSGGRGGSSGSQAYRAKLLR